MAGPSSLAEPIEGDEQSSSGLHARLPLDEAAEAPPLWQVPGSRDYRAPDWFERLPTWLGSGAVLLLLLAVSAVIRLHYLSGPLWEEEAGTVGIAGHPFTAIPGLLWKEGAPPLYFLLLHVWIDAFGASETAVHSLSVLFGLASVPVAMWLGWSLFGRRAGYIAGVLFALNGLLTQLAEQARPYELMGLLGLLASGAFLHVFVHRRRGRHLVLLGVSLLLLAYTDYWGFVFWAALGLALLPLVLLEDRGDARRAILRDALLAFLPALLLFAPWLPTLVHQLASSTSPWHYVPVPGANMPRKLLGTDRVVAVMAIGLVAGLAPLVSRGRGRSFEASAALALICLSLGAVLLSLLARIWVPSWDYRLFTPAVAPLLLLCALACARSNLLGLVLVALYCAFLANGSSFIAADPSDVSDISAQLSGQLAPGDAVLVDQPEQAPLAWYYLPAGLRYFTALGPDHHPSYMIWQDAMTGLERSSPGAVVSGLVGSLRPGQKLLVIRPITEGEDNWSEPWSALVRRRAAQLGAALAANRSLRWSGQFAPVHYHGSVYLPSSALIFVKR